MISHPDFSPIAARRTAPLGIALSAITGLRGSLAAIAGLVFILRDRDGLLWIALTTILVIAMLNIAFAALQWRRSTFTIGVEDLRVDSGVLARSSRSVPYERIHDVNLEQGPLARIFGLVKVAFDTGAGGKDELALAYLRESDGEDLRALIRARRAGSQLAPTAQDRLVATARDDAVTLFAMGPRRVITFGLFEFSLAVIAVLFGVTQQFDFLLPFDLWDWQGWQERLSVEVAWLAGLGSTLQVIGAAIAIVSLLAVGFITGVVRTVLREWGFRLEETERGFRRRRGLLTRTDVVMPIRRVQAIRIGTGILRRRFGWHGLTFLSLAKDAGQGSHVVAPFGYLAELWPIVRSAGFEAPTPDVAWHRATVRYRRDGILLVSLPLLAVALVVLAAGGSWWAMAPAALGLVLAINRWLAWRNTSHGLDDRQILARRGWLAPRLEMARRVKLQSVEFRQGPFGRRHGYGTIHLGIAGGTMAIPGVCSATASALRRHLLDSIAEVDFSRIDGV